MCNANPPTGRTRNDMVLTMSNKTRMKPLNWMVRHFSCSNSCNPDHNVSMWWWNEAKPIIMEVDTGAAVFIISDATRKDKFLQLKLHKSNIVLKTYIDEPMKVVGQLIMCIQYETPSCTTCASCSSWRWSKLLWLKLLKYNIHLDWSWNAILRN